MTGSFTPDDEQAVRRSETFHDLAALALRIMERVGPPLGIVCGPISSGGTGSPEKNLTVFAVYIKACAQNGHRIFNQLPFERDISRILRACGYPEGDPAGRQKLLREFYLPLFESGFIDSFHFIPGWETSEGARWEHAQAVRLGIRIAYLASYCP